LIRVDGKVTASYFDEGFGRRFHLFNKVMCYIGGSNVIIAALDDNEW
jgi:hypothetical protein